MQALIAVPIGDPAGIGPEIIVRALSDKTEMVQKNVRVLVIGDSRIIEQAIRITNVSLTIRKITNIENLQDSDFSFGVLTMLAIDTIDMETFSIGTIDGMCGKAAYAYIEKSIELALAKKVDAIATAPINKESLKAGNIPFIGHTEIFAHLTNTADPLTMFEVKGLRIFFLTRHVSLRKACDMVTKERIIDYVKRCYTMLNGLGVTSGTMAIAGLNPHSGEHGLFGEEEVNEVIPAVAQLRSQGIAVDGPIGADSVFHQALHGKYNSVLSLYHDQGHIAAKTLDFERTISVTGGMPILRTSVDHGTALDIAGKGIASHISMIEAIKLAAEYSLRR